MLQSINEMAHIPLRPVFDIKVRRFLLDIQKQQVLYIVDLSLF